MKSEQKRSFVRGAAILGLAGLVCKVIGALFRLPLYNLLEDGMAYYEAVYPYYSWLLVVSSAGIPTAISRMVAERVAMGDHAGARRVFHRAQALLVGIGLVTTLIMFFGAGWFASLVEVGEGVVLSFRALAPALLFVSVMCAYRGYLQGLQCMSGTAVSQLVEQVVKLVAGLFFAAKLLPMGLEYAAMGALLGISLSELLASAGGDPDEELSDGETPDEPETVRIDPDCAEKLEHARGRILNLIKEKRPRFVPAFELMTFRDNTISVSVPTTELREEILRSKTGMLMRIAELAGIEGMIELEVTVNEEIRAARPIKLEDRVRYITEKNPLVAELRKALDLEVE